MSTILFPGVLQLKIDRDDPTDPGNYTVQISVETLAATERNAKGLLLRRAGFTPAKPAAVSAGGSIDGALTLYTNPDKASELDVGDLMLQLVDALGAFVTADTDPNVITKMAAFLLQGENVKLTGKFTAPLDAGPAAAPVNAPMNAPMNAPVDPKRIERIKVGARPLANPASIDPLANEHHALAPLAEHAVALPDPPASIEVDDQDNGGDLIGERSGVVNDNRMFSKLTPVTMRRATLPLTADVALWILIKRNADMLSWDNYTRNLDLLFFTGKSVDGIPLYNEATRLSRRRFLPFTDTEAYRALKVATEAFVVTWGAVVQNGDDIVMLKDLLMGDQRAVALANERLGLNLNTTDVSILADMYFKEKGQLDDSPSVPYLERIVSQLQGTGAGEIAVEMTKEIRGERSDQCGGKCLWLTQWNNNYSAKLLHPPLVELIWSYWMEELQLVQTMNAVSRRFQNISSGPRDPLGQLELDSLRPLNNLIWGWVQDEQHRLPIERRAAEYAHQYGLQLFGRAVPKMRTADNRSKFLEAFHTLLNLCVPFFRQADDTTVVPDGFPILNALREVHLILSEGAHNQFLDLPTTSRIEMMMQQWLLARPEFREYLPRRAMVAYPEPWMHSVESMRKLQGWGDTNSFQFWQLATMGEQIVSSIRWGDWNSINDPANAANWATFFRPEIQAYIHSYRAVTGVDVSAEPVDVQVPGIHLLRRLRERRGSLAA
jgi:hypothetical protein